jgi:hypothetical protein
MYLTEWHGLYQGILIYRINKWMNERQDNVTDPKLILSMYSVYYFLQKGNTVRPCVHPNITVNIEKFCLQVST